MTQMRLLAGAVPEAPTGIDLRCCDVAELLADMERTGERADLVVADPPWTYSAGVPGHGFMGDHYEGLAHHEIVAHVTAASRVAATDAYLALWCTWPMLHEWMSHGRLGWTYKTGGSWHKTGKLGTGYHWRGQTEPLLVYVRGKPKPYGTIRNGHQTDNRPGPRFEWVMAHSEKPLAWARDHVHAWCPPGGLVLDLYAGMAPYARACLLEGRRYVGAEIAPDRHAAALSLLAQTREEP